MTMGGTASQDGNLAQLSYVTSFLLAPTQNSQDLEKSVCSRDPKADEARGRPKELSTDTSTLFPLQDPREALIMPVPNQYLIHCS